MSPVIAPESASEADPSAHELKPPAEIGVMPSGTRKIFDLRGTRAAPMRIAILLYQRHHGASSGCRPQRLAQVPQRTRAFRVGTRIALAQNHATTAVVVVARIEITLGGAEQRHLRPLFASE